MSPLIAHPIVIGNGRKFASVIICPNFPALEQWAAEQGITFKSRDDLVSNAQVIAAYDSVVTGVNSELAHFETLKKFLVVPDDFTVAAGEVTPTLKLRRRTIEQKYKSQIDALYSGPAPA
jgi:long-chain acyl-CoA synthetase